MGHPLTRTALLSMSLDLYLNPALVQDLPDGHGGHWNSLFLPLSNVVELNKSLFCVLYGSVGLLRMLDEVVRGYQDPGCDTNCNIPCAHDQCLPLMNLLALSD